MASALLGGLRGHGQGTRLGAEPEPTPSVESLKAVGGGRWSYGQTLEGESCPPVRVVPQGPACVRLVPCRMRLGQGLGCAAAGTRSSKQRSSGQAYL